MLHTYRGEGVIQIVNSPGNDDNVIDVEPEGEHRRGQTHTCRAAGHGQLSDPHPDVSYGMKHNWFEIPRMAVLVRAYLWTRGPFSRPRDPRQTCTGPVPSPGGTGACRRISGSKSRESRRPLNRRWEAKAVKVSQGEQVWVPFQTCFTHCAPHFIHLEWRGDACVQLGLRTGDTCSWGCLNELPGG